MFLASKKEIIDYMMRSGEDPEKRRELETRIEKMLVWIGRRRAKQQTLLTFDMTPPVQDKRLKWKGKRPTDLKKALDVLIQ